MVTIRVSGVPYCIDIVAYTSNPRPLPYTLQHKRRCPSSDGGRAMKSEGVDSWLVALHDGPSSCSTEV